MISQLSQGALLRELLHFGAPGVEVEHLSKQWELKDHLSALGLVRELRALEGALRFDMVEALTEVQRAQAAHPRSAQKAMERFNVWAKEKVQKGLYVVMNRKRLQEGSSDGA